MGPVLLLLWCALSGVVTAGALVALPGVSTAEVPPTNVTGLAPNGLFTAGAMPSGVAKLSFGEASGTGPESAPCGVRLAEAAPGVVAAMVPIGSKQMTKGI